MADCPDEGRPAAVGPEDAPDGVAGRVRELYAMVASIEQRVCALSGAMAGARVSPLPVYSDRDVVLMCHDALTSMHLIATPCLSCVPRVAEFVKTLGARPLFVGTLSLDQLARFLQPRVPADACAALAPRVFTRLTGLYLRGEAGSAVDLSVVACVTDQRLVFCTSRGNERNSWARRVCVQWAAAPHVAYDRPVCP